MPGNAIPISLVSGFLGSGKTTLLNHILQSDHGLRIAVMVNDFGDINIDAELIVNARQNVISLANGCICCSLETDLIEQLEQMLTAHPSRPDYIVIETSGISDPARVLATLKYPRFAGRLRLDNAITLLDAEQLPRLEGANRELARCQLTDANLVVINKADLVTDANLTQLRKEWLFPDSRCYVTRRARVPIPLLFGQANLLIERESKKTSESNDFQHEFVQWSWESDRPFTSKKLRKTLAEMPASVYRAKGILYIAEAADQLVELQLVGHRIELKKLGAWTQSPRSRLVMIASGEAEDFSAIDRALHTALA